MGQLPLVVRSWRSTPILVKQNSGTATIRVRLVVAGVQFIEDEVLDRRRGTMLLSAWMWLVLMGGAGAMPKHARIKRASAGADINPSTIMPDLHLNQRCLECNSINGASGSRPHTNSNICTVTTLCSHTQFKPLRRTKPPKGFPQYDTFGF